MASSARLGEAENEFADNLAGADKVLNTSIKKGKKRAEQEAKEARTHLKTPPEPRRDR
jgi:hypothetical protein